jgi:hypothetical protein
MTLIRLTSSGPPKDRRSSYAGSTVHGWKVAMDSVTRDGVEKWGAVCLGCGAVSEKSTIDLGRLAAEERKGRGRGGCNDCRLNRLRVPDEKRVCQFCQRPTFRHRGDTSTKCKTCMQEKRRERLAAEKAGQ